jgi:hypothetical protein
MPDWVPWNQFQAAVVESPAEIRFLDLNSPEDRAAAPSFPRGLAFGQHAEIRWFQRRAGLHLVYITDLPVTLPAPNHPECADSQGLRRLSQDTEPQQIFLWGLRDNAGDYLEGRIPFALRYPEPQPGLPPEVRRAVQVRHYELEHSAPGSIPTRLLRCVALSEVHP